MPQYKVIKPINAGSGFLMDISGNSVSVQSLVPKVGDVISGTIETKVIFEQNVTGISYPITTGRSDISGNSLIFIPSNSVELVSPNSNNGNSSQKLSQIKTFFTPKNIIIGSIAILVILKLTKII